jgi:hypothetical protein
MKKSFTVLFIFIFLSFSFTKTNAQDDCCGLGSVFSSVLYSGIHGGYGFQQFSAEGFNHYIAIYNQERTTTLTQKMDEFGFATGFKFGANLFQFMVDDFIIGMKLSYHILKEEHNATSNVTGGIARREYELTYKSFHAGLSFAYYISKHFDLKIADLMVTFNSADLENRIIQPNLPTDEQKLTSVDNPIGFNASTGFTFYIMPPYLSIEGTVGYSLFSIDEMEFENGNRLQVDENNFQTMTNFIDGGGLYAFAQLNIAVPFN